MRTTHRIGTHPDGGTVYVEIEISTKNDGTRELTISGTAPGTCGQIRDTVAQVVSFAPGWNASKRDTLLAYWDAWHLNGMRPNCQHQVGPAWTPKDIEITSYSIDWDVRRVLERQYERAAKSHNRRATMDRAHLTAAVKWSPAAEILLCLLELGIKPFDWVPLDCQYLTCRLNRLPFNMRPFIEKCPPDDPGHPIILVQRETKATNWLRESEHPDGYLCKPCPKCGYEYGSKWLHEPLPQEVIAWVEGLQAGGTTQAPETLEADGFLAAHGITFTAQRVQTKAGWASKAQHWHVTLVQPHPERESHLSVGFDFWASQHDTEKGIDLQAASVLSSLASDIGCEDVDELAQELELSPSQAIAAVAFGDQLRGFFTGKQRAGLEQLR